MFLVMTICFPILGEQKSSNSKDAKRNLAPAVKERIPAGSSHEELLTEVEKQYVVVTAPKVSPKPKKPAKDSSSSSKTTKESTLRMDVDTETVDGKVEGGNLCE